MLREFIIQERDEILTRAGARLAERKAPVATETEITHGLPVFLGQLEDALRRASTHESVDHQRMKESASHHGDALFHRGLSVAQVVHGYGDLCQAITGLAIERNAPIGNDEFQTLNLCLDDAIAGAVTAHGRQAQRAVSDEGTERLGALAHEMRNVLSSAILTFASIRSGAVAPGGSTGAMHQRSLLRLSTLIDRSLADVRLEAGTQNLERVPVRDIIEEVEMGASVVAQSRGLELVIQNVGAEVTVEADRQILAAAVANLVQNAFKFTKPHTAVTLRASATADRAVIEVEDRCGGLPPGAETSLLKPFVQHGHDRTGLGLGLSICTKAAKAMGGELKARDLPGVGCVFTIDLPRQPAPGASVAGATPPRP